MHTQSRAPGASAGPILACLNPEGIPDGGGGAAATGFPHPIVTFDSVLCLTGRNPGLIGEEN